MYSRMEMPKYSNVFRLVAEIGAIVGIAFGVIYSFIGLAAFQYGFAAGLGGLFTGVMTMLGSLASLGLVYCFLSLVEAQIDTRNAILSNFKIDLTSPKQIYGNEIKTSKNSEVHEEERLFD